MKLCVIMIMICTLKMVSSTNFFRQCCGSPRTTSSPSRVGTRIEEQAYIVDFFDVINLNNKDEITEEDLDRFKTGVCKTRMDPLIQPSILKVNEVLKETGKPLSREELMEEFKKRGSEKLLRIDIKNLRRVEKEGKVTTTHQRFNEEDLRGKFCLPEQTINEILQGKEDHEIHVSELKSWFEKGLKNIPK